MPTQTVLHDAIALHIRRHAVGSLAALAIAATAASGPAHADEFNWVGTWGAGPEAFGPASFNNQTVRQIVRISVGGSQFRIRLSNEFGTQAVQIGDAHLAISAGAGAIKAGTDRVLTFSGNPTITIPQSAAVLSDPVGLDAPNLTSLAVSLYLPQATGVATHHNDLQTAYIVTGDTTSAADVSTGGTTALQRFFLSGVEAASPPPKSAVVTFGDSITDGQNSTPNANHRWPDFLAARLAAHGDDHIGVVNEGMGRDALLNGGFLGLVPNAQGRFDRDVLATSGVRFMTVLLGINDINLNAANANDIIAAHRQLIIRAHSHGILAYGCTLTPASLSSQNEAIRQAVNTWIRTSGEYDAVIDFDAATRDPANPIQFFPAFDSGDHLHPNDAGYQAMANAIDLRLFKVGVGETNVGEKPLHAPPALADEHSTPL